MRFTNRFPLLLLLCMIGFPMGFLHTAASVGFAYQMSDHSWSLLDLYGYFVAAPLLMLPLVVYWFSRRVAWGILTLGVLLFTISTPIMALATEEGAMAYGCALFPFGVGVCMLLILTNRKVTDELATNAPTKLSGRRKLWFFLAVVAYMALLVCLFFYPLVTMEGPDSDAVPSDEGLAPVVTVGGDGATNDLAEVSQIERAMIATHDWEIGLVLGVTNLDVKTFQSEYDLPNCYVPFWKGRELLGRKVVAPVGKGQPVEWHHVDAPKREDGTRSP